MDKTNASRVVYVARRTNARITGICINFEVYIYPPVDGEKINVKLTTLPRIFIHAVCRFNSIAFAIQLVFWCVLRFPR